MPSKSEQWNGKKFIVNIDYDKLGACTWIDCQKYGFISASGGKWYRHTLNHLFIGERVYAMISKKGYVGVGIVNDFKKQNMLTRTNWGLYKLMRILILTCIPHTV